MSGRLKSDSLPKRTQKICFPSSILPTARLLNSLGKVSCCKSHLAGDRMCDFRPWLCDFHVLPSVGAVWEASALAPPRPWQGGVMAQIHLSVHDCTHIKQMPSLGLGMLMEGLQRNEDGFLMLVSWHVRVWECSAGVHSHTGRNELDTHPSACETLASNMHRSPAMQVKGGILYICLTGKYIKKCFCKHYSKRS